MKKISEVKKSILIVSGRDLNCYGVQVSILNTIRNASECSFTWYCPGKSEEKFEEEVRRAGVEIITGDLDLEYCRRRVIHQTIVRDVWRLCHEKNYDIIHVNTGLMGTMAFSLSVAWLCGVPCRIAHSHNNTIIARGTYIRRTVLHALILLSTTKFVACSEPAAEFMFGKKRAHGTEIFPNAIDLKKYSFSRSKREAVRRELGLMETHVFGHVGGFRVEKNHEFLLNVFVAIVGKDSKSRLLLAGDGKLEQQIRQRAVEYGIVDKVIFAGHTDRVDELLCAMDVFILPSLFEGLPFACIEAQATGLPCVISDVITQEVNQTGNVRFLSLELGPEKWADELLNLIIPDEKERLEVQNKMVGTPYDIDLLSKYVERLYEVRKKERYI